MSKQAKPYAVVRHDPDNSSDFAVLDYFARVDEAKEFMRDEYTRRPGSYEVMEYK